MTVIGVSTTYYPASATYKPSSVNELDGKGAWLQVKRKVNGTQMLRPGVRATFWIPVLFACLDFAPYSNPAGDFEVSVQL